MFSARPVKPLKRIWHSLCDVSQCHTSDHWVLSTWQESEQFIAHTVHSVATKICMHIFACATEHVWESENKIGFWPRLLPWMRRDQSVAFCSVCQVSLPTASRDCPVSTSNPSNLPTRTIVDYRWQLWLQTFVLSVWLFHRCLGANSSVHADTAGTVCPWSHLLSPPSELF